MKTNPLGDGRAEHDHKMLDTVFYETPEYRSLIEEHTRRVVVGRRGTGKSALFYKLERHWKSASKTSVVVISPSETDIIGLRPFVSLFGEKPSYLRAACSLAWQYGILQEVVLQLGDHYKVRSDANLQELSSLARAWRRRGTSLTSRLFNALEEKVDKSTLIEKRVATLAHTLAINDLFDAAQRAVEISKLMLHITADRLDEGYEPDPIGVSILTGLVYAFDKLAASIAHTATAVFLRDNIFRAIQIHDPDYSRNIEGDVLRLHWDEYHLFNMICNRIRAAFGVEQEKNLRAWDRVTSRDLSGMDGFRRCLRLTLYRPRDLMVLLNNAFNHAQSHDRDTIVNEDIEATSREVSCSRLDDLKKEYREIIPGISQMLGLFADGTSSLTLSDIDALMPGLMNSKGLTPAAGQTFALMRSPEDLVHNLYSVGFLGVWKSTSSSYVFCHDGKAPDLSVDANSRILIHPCYWIALNLRGDALEVSEIEDIHDEYDIEVCSETPEIRKRKLARFTAQLDTIREGDTDSSKFEEWCLQAIQIVFAVGIVNAELHPNRNLTQRRDVIGRNAGSTETWKRILDDYQSRQVVFEAKNYSHDLGPTEYRQMLSYLSGEHGRLGFIINRSKQANLEKDRELHWVREMYHEHERRVIVKLPAPLFVSWLSKLRSPQKHDAPDKGLGALLDTYERMYVRLGGATPKRKR